MSGVEVDRGQGGATAKCDLWRDVALDDRAQGSVLPGGELRRPTAAP